MLSSPMTSSQKIPIQMVMEAYNSKFYGWTSYAGTIGTGYFEGCTFGAGAGYNFSRPYAPTTYVNCTFGVHVISIGHRGLIAPYAHQ